MLQASSLALIGMLTVVGCGGSDNNTPKKYDGSVGGGSGQDGGAPGVVKVDKALLDFGPIDVGSTSTAQTVNVNVTGGTVTTNVTVTGAGFALAGTTCASVQTGACTVSVKFAPATIGAASGVLAIGGVTIALTGTGNKQGIFALTPDRTELGTVKPGATAPVALQIVPDGSITGLTCASSNTTELAPNAATTTCTTGAITAPCTVGFTFTAGAVGPKTDLITCSASGKTATSTVVANVVGPALLAVSQSSALFTAVVNKTDSVVITVSNNGGSATAVAPTASISAGATDFAITANDCVVALAPLATCKVTVTFAPKTAGAKTGSLSVTDGTTTLPVSLSGTARDDRNVAISPSPADFGSVQIGTPRVLTLTMKNTGGTATGLLTLSGSTDEFKVGNDQCSGTALAATSGQCTFDVTFSPASPASTAPRASIINAADPAGVVASVKVTGIATAAPIGAVLTMTPPTLDFATIGVGTTSAPKTFTVTNTGDTDSGPLSVVKNDSTSSVGGAAQFPSTTTCVGPLAKGASCQIVVTFVPTIKGSASATLTVTDGVALTPARTVVGIAIDKPKLTVTCGSSGSGSTTNVTASDESNAWFTPGVVAGKPSSAVVCTVKNDSDSAQDSGAITVATTGDFAAPAASNNCTASLAPGLSCIFSITFTPTAKGPRNGTLTVSGANGFATNLNIVGTGLGVVELVVYKADRCSPTAAGDFFTFGQAVHEPAPQPCVAETQPYDFGQVSVGGESSPSKTVYVAAFVRSDLGTMISTQTLGTPADFSVESHGKCPAAGASVTVGAIPSTTTTAYCYYTVKFTPKSKTAKTGTLALTGANNATDSATLSGTGTGPLTIAPAPAAFGTVAVGSSAPALVELTLSNNSATADVTSLSYTLTPGAGTTASEFVVVTDGVANQTIAKVAGGVTSTKKMTIKFVPATTGAKTATLTVSGTYGAGTESTSVVLTGTGGAPASLTAVLAGAITDTAINGSSMFTVNVTNGGGSPTSAILASVVSGEFNLTPPTGKSPGTCGNAFGAGDTPLAAGASCTINVWFKPVAGLGVGARTGTLRVSAATGGSTNVALSAKATPQLTITPATIQDFGSVLLLDASQTAKVFTVTNNSDTAANLTVQSVANTNLVPSSPDYFKITNNCTAAVAAKGGTCTFSVKFVPTNKGLVYATLKVVDTAGAPAQQATVDAQGTGLKPAELVFSKPTAIDRDFGSVLLGNYSSLVTYTLTNRGDVTSGALNWAFLETTNGQTHKKAADFAQDATTTCSKDSGLAAGASCNLVLAFHPTACSGSSCTTTDAVSVYLTVTADPGAPTAGVPVNHEADLGDWIRPKLTGQASPANTLVESVTGNTPYVLPALGTASSLTVAMKFSAGSEGYHFAQNVKAAVADAGAKGDSVVSLDGCVGANCEFVVDTSAANTCFSAAAAGVTLAANASCVFNVVWTPAVGSDAGKREVTITLGGVSATLIATKPVAATLDTTPDTSNGSPLNLGTLLQASATTTVVKVTNNGDLGTAGNLAALPTAGQTDDVAVNPTGCIAGAALGAGQTCDLSITITPTATGAKTAQVTVSAGGGLTKVVYLSWTALIPAQLKVDKTTVDFTGAAVAVGTAAAPVTVTVSTVTNGKLSGALSIAVDNANFSVDAGTADGDCGLVASNGLGTGLNVATSCKVYVTFNPTVLAPTSKTGKLTITSTSGASAQSILLGTSKAAVAASVPASTHATVSGTTITFDSTQVGSDIANHPTARVTFTNASGAPTTGNLAVALTGANAADVVITSDGCSGKTLTGTAGDGDSCSITLRFDPASAGTGKSATLAVSGTPGDSASVTLAGAATN